MKRTEKEVLKFFIISFLQNAVVIICFTILAIIFKKWWLTLFSIIFWNNFRFKLEEDGDKEMEDDVE